MTDLAVTHNAFRQAYIGSEGAYLGKRAIAAQGIGHRGAGQLYGVEFVMAGIMVFAPAIADDKRDRFILHYTDYFAGSPAAVKNSLKKEAHLGLTWQ